MTFVRFAKDNHMTARRTTPACRATRNPLTVYAAVGVVAALLGVPPSLAGTYDLTIGEASIDVSGSKRTALAVNGSVPGPSLRFKEGEDLVIQVTNTHWFVLS